MQAQPLTWQAVVLQLLLSLGPAAIALAATYFTLRHQRKLKQDELSSASTLKARELIFNYYQKNLDRISALSEELVKAMHEFRAARKSPGTTDIRPARVAFMKSLSSFLIMAKREAEGAEDELRTYGLEKKYEYELGVVRQAIEEDEEWDPGGDQEQLFEEVSNQIDCLTVVQEAALEARMKDLFSEYLPTRRTPKLNS